MLTARCRLAATLILGSFAVATLALPAKDPVATQPGTDRQPAGQPAKMPVAPHAAPVPEDLPFRKYVDLRLLGRAWKQRDPVMLTDVALQLAEGERVLFRSHPAISAEEVFKIAAYLAADLKDTVTLNRLELAARLLNNAELSALLAGQKKLAGTSRDVTAGVKFTVKDVQSGADALFAAYVAQIRTRKLAGGTKALESLKREVAREKTLSAALKSNLTTQADEALEAVGPRNPSIKLLQKLGSRSRDGFGVSQGGGGQEEQAGEEPSTEDESSSEESGSEEGSTDEGSSDPSTETEEEPDPSEDEQPEEQPEDDAPAPPRRVSFSIMNYCPFDVQVQIHPSGEPFDLPAKKMFTGYWVTSDGSQPSITILATGKRWRLDTGRYQVYRDDEGHPNWALR